MRAMNRTTRLAGGIAVALLLAASSAGAASARHGAAGYLGPAQQLATLNHDTGAFLAPGPHTARVTELSDARPITGERTVLPVVGRATGPYGLRWLEVLLPG